MKIGKRWTQITCGRSVAKIARAVAVAARTSANAETRRVQVGTLTCSVSAGIGLVVGSQRNVSCLFRGRRVSRTRVGLDFGFTAGSVIGIREDRALQRDARRHLHRRVGGNVPCWGMFLFKGMARQSHDRCEAIAARGLVAGFGSAYPAHSAHRSGAEPLLF